MTWLRTVAEYIKNRIDERSTWLLVGTAIAAASQLKWPWSLASVIAGVLAAMVPDGPAK